MDTYKIIRRFSPPNTYGAVESEVRGRMASPKSVLTRCSNTDKDVCQTQATPLATVTRASRLTWICMAETRQRAEREAVTIIVEALNPAKPRGACKPEC